MKKIFAIALALVMVLSMASAFASPCTAGFDWTCVTTDTDCGKATVEVVPYVKTNDACNKVTYVQSDCAAAINGENVYFALKMTVDKDIDLDWLKQATVELSVKGMEKKDFTETFKNFKLNKDESEDGWVLYLNTARNQWVDATEVEDFDIATVMHKFVVREYAKAKVCLTLKSSMNADKGKFSGVVGDYYVVYTKNEVIDTIEPTAGEILDALTADEYDLYTGTPVVEPVKPVKTGTTAAAERAYKAALAQYEEDYAEYEEYVAVMDKVEGLTVVVVADFLRVYDEKGGKLLVEYRIDDGKVAAIDYTAWCGEAAYATIKAFFGLEIGTCVDKDLITANFGWKDEVKSCYAWKTEGTAVVDPECVVAIPKTGDASVLAWLF